MRSLFFSLALIMLQPRAWSAAAVDVQISSVGDTVHFEFEGLNKWNYESNKKLANGHTIIEVTVPDLKAEAVNKLTSFKSSDVKSIQVTKSAPDGRYLIKIEFSSDKMESFDYLTDQPSRLVVDMFPSKAKKKADTTQSAQSADSDANKSGKETKTAKLATKAEKTKRVPASTDLLVIGPDNPQGNVGVDTSTLEKRKGIFDGADPGFDRFQIKDFEIKEESIIASSEKYFISMPILRVPLEDFSKLNTYRPYYEIQAADNDENKQARLLLTLYRKKRYNVFLKTIDWFLQKYPASKYDEIVRFMWADVLYDQWRASGNSNDFELSMLRYRQAIEKYPNSELVDRTQLLMGYASFERGDYLGTIREFEKQLRSNKSDKIKDRAKFGIAEAYLKLARNDQALEAYKEIESTGSDNATKVEAAYREGDVHMIKKDYSSALSEYKRVLAKYPEGAKIYPNVLFNQASALFISKDYKASLSAFTEFIKNFPSHEYAAYGLTRVGELLEVLGAPESRVRGAYLEAFFRYGDSPSAIVARLHLLSSGMKEMKPNEVEKAVNDIQVLSKKSELENIEQFATIMIAEGFNGRQDYDRAIKLLVDFYQAHPIGIDHKLVATRIIQNINQKIASLTASGQFLEALKTHNEYAESWLKNSDRIDTKINIASDFEQAGAFGEAEKLFRGSLNQVLALKGTSEEKAKRVIEKLPSEDHLYLRLAACLYHSKKFQEAYENLKNAKHPESLSEKEQVERIQLASSLLAERGDMISAARNLVDLIKEWSGEPHLLAEPYFQLGQIEAKKNETAEAIKSFKKIDELMRDSGAVAEDTHAKALEKLGDLQCSTEKTDECLNSWGRLLDLYESKRALGAIRYKLGKVFFEKGNIQKANEIWNPLNHEKSSVWWNLAQEQLKHSDWSNNYKKYIQRIPAMSERGANP